MGKGNRSIEEIDLLQRGTMFREGRPKSADGRVSYKLRNKLWPSQPILVETFQISP